MPPPIKLDNFTEFEVLIIYEAHALLSYLIHPDLYEVTGNNEYNQEARFHSEVCYDLFLTRLVEFTTPGQVEIGTKKDQYSLLRGLQWLVQDRYPDDISLSQLRNSVNLLSDWLGGEIDFDFWCGELEMEFHLRVNRSKIINWCSNFTKHTITRLNHLLCCVLFIARLVTN
jgi:hypothetical protein